MSTFVDIRVPRADVAIGVQVICDFADRHARAGIFVDPSPASAGPESEITVILESVMMMAADGIVDELRAKGVSVLAWRSRHWERS